MIINLKNVQVGDVVLLTTKEVYGEPYFDIVTRVGNTFIEIGYKKYRKSDGGIIGCKNDYQCVVCKKDDLENILMRNLEIKI